jgi:glutamate 5-kinase
MIVESAIQLLQDGHRVIIVSSGAIGVGLRRMDIERKPKYLPKVQVLGLNLYQHTIQHDLT